MLLGKRPQIRRTTSMKGITVDLPNNTIVDPSQPWDHDHGQNKIINGIVSPNNGEYNDYYKIFLNKGDDPRLLATMVSPRNYNNMRNRSKLMISSGFGDNYDYEDHQQFHFLRTCGHCQRRLAPNKDIYMYRGDTAFCSVECREQQMKQDEKKEKANASS